MWDKRIQELIQFQQKHGHCDLPSDSEDYKELSAWIRQVRSAYTSWTNGNKETEVELTEGRIAELQNLGLQIYLLEPVHRGKRRLKELLAYKRLYGHHYCGPSNSADFPKLTKWLKKLQTVNVIREKQEIPILMEVQLSQLEKIGYDFNEFMTRHSVPPPTRGSSEEGWNCHVERYCMKYANGVSNREKAKSLAERSPEYRDSVSGSSDSMKPFSTKKINFGNVSRSSTHSGTGESTDPSSKPHTTPTVHQSGASFDQRLEELRDFQKRHGHCRVPSSKPEYKKLYSWICNCRTKYRVRMRGMKGGLTEEQISKMKATGFEFPVSWEDRLNQLMKFRESHGHFLVSRFVGNDQALGLWVYNRQLDFQKVQQGEPARQLTPDHVRQLKAIGFNLELPFADDEIWTRGLQQLKDFILKYGHFKVPENDEKHRSLWQWLRDNRDEYKKYMKRNKSRFTKDRDRQVSALKMLLKGARPSSTDTSIGSPKASDRCIPIVTPPRHSDSTMHPQREEENGNVEVVLVRSPKKNNIESSLAHASSIHHHHWEQQAWAPMHSDGRDFGYNLWIDDRYNEFHPPCYTHNNLARHSAQAPSHTPIPHRPSSWREPEVGRSHQSRAMACISSNAKSPEPEKTPSQPSSSPEGMELATDEDDEARIIEEDEANKFEKYTVLNAVKRSLDSQAKEIVSLNSQLNDLKTQVSIKESEASALRDAESSLMNEIAIVQEKLNAVHSSWQVQALVLIEKQQEIDRIQQQLAQFCGGAHKLEESLLDERNECQELEAVLARFESDSLSLAETQQRRNDTGEPAVAASDDAFGV